MSYIFISHIKEEEDLALKLKEYLDRDFLGNLTVFLSSEDLRPGVDWFKEIIDNLQKTEMLLLMCSPRSIGRSWLHFEAGAIFIREKPVIPICYGGFEISALPPQFGRMQAIALVNPDHVRRLYEEIAIKLLTCNLPLANYEEMAGQLDALVPKPKILFIVSHDLKIRYYDKGELSRLLPHLEVKFIDYQGIDVTMASGEYKKEYAKIVYHHPHPTISDAVYLQLVERLKNDKASLPLIIFSDSQEGRCTDFQAGPKYTETSVANMLTTLIQRINE
jgi:hypothetical protein